jgi:cytochrome bd ubiquinol oxidase subunit II
MLQLIIIILGVSFILYTILGGADFGAGIVETFAGRRQEPTISKAIAPVWEANHIWLILAVVILFTGFPAVYASLSLVLHIPLMLVLLGIICRGTAFSFRHYDVVQDRSHQWYGWLFRASSFITPLFLGMTLGAMILGRITFDHSSGFYAMFLHPWLNVFCLVMGIFSICLFGFIAAVFLVGEAGDEVSWRKYVRLSKRFLLATVLSGIAVFAAAEWEGHPLFDEFVRSPRSIAMLALAVLLIPVMLYFLNRKHNKTVYLRIATGIQCSAILAGWFYIQYPVLIQVSNGQHLTFLNTAAPEATLKQLLIALVVGLVLVVPAFLYLFKVFKVKKSPAGP